MSGFNNSQGGTGIGSLLISGWTTMTTVLQNIQQSIANLVTAINTLASIPSANNNFTGNNTFTGTNSFKPPPIISAGAVGSGTLLPAGVISRQFNRSGVGNGADTTNDVLFSYAMPANSFDVNGRGVKIRAFGFYAANGNDKRVRLTFGGVELFTSGVVTFNAGWWRIDVELYRDGANTQLGSSWMTTKDTVIGPVTVLTGVTDTAAITIAVTGASPTTGAASDVNACGLIVEFMN